MLNSRKTLVQVSGMALALAASSEFVAASLMTRSAVLAQSPAPTTFPLPSAVPSGSSVKVDGSSSMAVTNEAIKKQYEERFPGATVTLGTIGTDEALKSLQAGTLDVAAVGRALTDEERAQVVSVPLKREKIAIIVGPDNPFKGNLTFEQFAKMFRGEIRDWSEVGGPAGPIKFVDRPASSDTRLSLSKYEVFQVAPFQTGPNTTQVATDDTATVIQALGKDGISYSIANQVLDQPNVRVVPMHQTLPDDPRYPFSQPQGYAHKQGAALSPAQLGFLGLATGATAAAVVPAAASTPEAAPSPVASPEVSPTPVATQTGGGGFPWWLLLLPLLGVLGWFLLRGRGAAPVAAPPAPVPVPPPVPVPVPVAAPIPESRIILTPRDCRDAYAYWEVPEARKAEMRRQGGRKLMVRLYDVTDLDMDRQTPHSVKQFDCDEADPDLHLPISVDDRDYIAELGYVADDGRWLPVARSQHVRVPACPPVVEDGLRLPNVAAIGGVAAAGLGAVAAARALAPEPEVPLVPVAPVVPPEPVVPSRIILTPRTSEDAYAYWETPEVNKAALRDRGGRDLQLRIYDATDIDLDMQPAHSVQTYAVAELDQDRHVPIPLPDRDYVAEIGYATAEGDWLQLARSAPVRVQGTKLPDAVPIVGAALGGVALAGATIAKAVAPDEARVPAVPSRIILTPRSSEDAYAYWEAPEVNKAALRDRGGRDLQLRIYDATDIDLDTQPAHNVQTYDIDDLTQDRHVPIPLPDRDYVAEVGYATAEGDWLMLARSAPVRVAAPASAPVVIPATEAATPTAPAARPIMLPSPILNTSPMPAHRLGEVVPSRVEYAPAEGALLPTAEHRCSIQHLRVNSRTSCYLMGPEEMNRLQSQTAATQALDVGHYLVRIKSGMFGYRSAGSVVTGEPLVLLWLYGGKVVNQKTNVPVNATWSSLNGYNETLALEVLEPATLCAFFFDTYLEDNEGEVTVSIVKL